MPDNTFAHRGFPPALSQGMDTLRTTLALGCAALALAGCGGGSGSTETPNPPTPSGLAAPENFTVGWNTDSSFVESFHWNATPDATRYELFIDPDGPGSLPEAQVDDSHGFSYSFVSENQWFHGFFSNAGYLDRINATYRLRACNASGCGAFTALQAFDIAKLISHDFPSGRAPLKTSGRFGSSHGFFDTSLSQDSLTLAVRVSGPASAMYVFARNSNAHPWQRQALLPFNTTYPSFALSADGDTLAVSVRANDDATVHMYQRNGSAWNQQTTIDSTHTPPTCPQPCSVQAINMALSADGKLLAVTATAGVAGSNNSVASTGAVLTYTRTGTAWAPQAYLTADGGISGTSMALSSDGRTLAVNTGGLGLFSGFSDVAFLNVFTQSSEGVWSQQGRMPAGIVADVTTVGSINRSAMALSSDGNTLAVHAQNKRGSQTAELDIGTGDLTCGSWDSLQDYIALFARDGSAWRRQAVMAADRFDRRRPWALANDGNALFIDGSALFTRSNGAWACP